MKCRLIRYICCVLFFLSRSSLIHNGWSVKWSAIFFESLSTQAYCSSRKWSHWKERETHMDRKENWALALGEVIVLIQWSLPFHVSEFNMCYFSCELMFHLRQTCITRHVTSLRCCVYEAKWLTLTANFNWCYSSERSMFHIGFSFHFQLIFSLGFFLKIWRFSKNNL